MGMRADNQVGTEPEQLSGQPAYRGRWKPGEFVVPVREDDYKVIIFAAPFYVSEQVLISIRAGARLIPVSAVPLGNSEEGK